MSVVLWVVVLEVVVGVCLASHSLLCFPSGARPGLSWHGTLCCGAVLVGERRGARSRGSDEEWTAARDKHKTDGGQEGCAATARAPSPRSLFERDDKLFGRTDVD